MKVPIRYKSSDRYNAGVDVVYDDESKMQYAPFVYATTASGDNGGDDEEGEDSMVVNIAYEGNNAVLGKNWSEIKGALDSGKFAYLIDTTADETTTTVRYITSCEFLNNTYIVRTKALDVSGETTYESSSATGVLVNSTGD